MNRGWLWIFAGGMAETAWAVFMKMSNGFTDILFDALMVVFLFISLYLLNRGFREGLPTGPGYAVWVGIGALGSVIVGILYFNDTFTILGWGCIALIIAGVVGLNLVSNE